MEIDVQIVIKAAEAGGKILKDYFGEVLEIEEKSHLSDVRTKADIDSEKVILEIITKAFPDFNIYSEETGRIDKKSDYTFVIDPLDGSSNFVLAVPDFTVSIGLMKNDEIILGVIHSPLTSQTFHAQKGKGAFMNGQLINVNHESDIKRATIGYVCGYTNSREYAQKIYKSLDDLGTKRQINFWSPAYDLCLLASGRIEGVINNKCELYDFAAGKLIVTEAGGKITGFKGEAISDADDLFIISNGSSIHQALINIV